VKNGAVTIAIICSTPCWTKQSTASAMDGFMCKKPIAEGIVGNRVSNALYWHSAIV